MKTKTVWEKKWRENEEQKGVCDRNDREVKKNFVRNKVTGEWKTKTLSVREVTGKWKKNSFVRDEVARERKTKKGVCERSDKKLKNKIFVRDEETGKRKTNRVPVREVIGK